MIEPTLDAVVCSYFKSPALHVVGGLFSMVLMAQDEIPIFILFYISVCAQVVFLVKCSGDVMSSPRFDVFLVMVVAQLIFTCHSVVHGDGIGPMVNQACYIAFGQTAIHFVYLTLSPNVATRRIGLGEGKGRQTFTGTEGNE